MNIQISILSFFQNLSTPFLDKIVSVITMLGEQTVVIAVAALIFWCIDKKKGYSICLTLLISILSMGIFKAIFKSPRPFQVLESIKGKRLTTATGYSFPSGHTTTASSFYTGVFSSFKKQIITVICLILIILVALSRLYLGVHWPIDVFGGLILGVGLTLLFYNKIYDLTNKKESFIKFTFWSGIVCSIAMIILSIILFLGKGDSVGLTDLTKTIALASGAFWGSNLEYKKINFSVDGTVILKLLRFFVGFVGVMAIMLLKNVFPYTIIFISLRYLLVGFWIFGLYPLVGKKIRLFSTL